MVFGIVTPALMSRLGFHWWIPIIGIVAGLGAGGLGWLLGAAAGGFWSRFMVNGTSTPYVEQYSYQQALVMKGEVDEALASFEDIIANKPEAVSPRIKAAELYVSERKNHQRAADLFREVQRLPSITAGEYVYATNRLVDLLLGPLADPGRALVELRRLIDRHPTSGAAVHARSTLAELKARMNI
jgi:tetratricopeptide (TPR) repeat protein